MVRAAADRPCRDWSRIAPGAVELTFLDRPLKLDVDSDHLRPLEPADARPMIDDDTGQPTWNKLASRGNHAFYDMADPPARALVSEQSLEYREVHWRRFTVNARD